MILETVGPNQHSVNNHHLAAILQKMVQQATGKLVNFDPTFAMSLIATNSNGTGLLDTHAASALLITIKDPILEFITGDADGNYLISAMEFSNIAMSVGIPLGHAFFDALLKMHFGKTMLAPSDGLDLNSFIKYMLAIQKMDAQLQFSNGFAVNYGEVQMQTPQQIGFLVASIKALS